MKVINYVDSDLWCDSSSYFHWFSLATFVRLMLRRWSKHTFLNIRTHTHMHTCTQDTLLAQAVKNWRCSLWKSIFASVIFWKIKRKQNNNYQEQKRRLFGITWLFIEEISSHVITHYEHGTRKTFAQIFSLPLILHPFLLQVNSFVKLNYFKKFYGS